MAVPARRRIRNPPMPAQSPVPDLSGGCTNFMSPSSPTTCCRAVVLRHGAPQTCEIHSPLAPPTTKVGDRTMGGTVKSWTEPRTRSGAPSRHRSHDRRMRVGDRLRRRRLGGCAGHRGRRRVQRRPRRQILRGRFTERTQTAQFQTGAAIFAPPTSYAIDGRQVRRDSVGRESDVVRPAREAAHVTRSDSASQPTSYLWMANGWPTSNLCIESCPTLIERRRRDARLKRKTVRDA